MLKPKKKLSLLIYAGTCLIASNVFGDNLYKGYNLESEQIKVGNFNITYSGDLWYNTTLENEIWDGASYYYYMYKKNTINAFKYWDNLIVKDANAPVINVSLAWSDKLPEGALAGASYSPHIHNNMNMSLVEALWKHNLSPNEIEDKKMEIVFSSKYNFLCTSGLAMVPYTEDYEGDIELYKDGVFFYSVLLHEIGHFFGFSSSIKTEDMSFINPTAFDNLMIKNNEDKTLYNTNEEYLLEGTGLKVYNPDPFEPGSSMCHVVKIEDELMTFQMSPGWKDGLSNNELDLMRAMGWTIIPEPSMFGLITGFGALMLVGMRRRN